MKRGSPYPVVSLHPRAAAAAFALCLAWSVPAGANSVSGAYLAGRQAAFDSNFDAAARYFGRALAVDSDNPELMENVALSQLALGRIDRALPK